MNRQATREVGPKRRAGKVRSRSLSSAGFSSTPHPSIILNPFTGFPELPSILVTGQSVEELTASAAEAIRIYWSHMRTDRSPTSTLREIEVELPV